MRPSDGVSRHDWVWLTRTWEAHLRSGLDPIARAELGAWLDGGRPLVVTRRPPEDAPGDLRLGLALPGRRRIGVHLSQGAVSWRSSPPSLRQVLGDSPWAWREPLEWLAAITEALGVPTGVYGSLAWQHFAGRSEPAYLSPKSDLDLVFTPPSWAATERLLTELASCGSRFPAPSLDGEVILPDGGGVAWRELAMRPEKLLVKSLDRVELRPFATLAGLFAKRAA